MSISFYDVHRGDKQVHIEPHGPLARILCRRSSSPLSGVKDHVILALNMPLIHTMEYVLLNRRGFRARRHVTMSSNAFFFFLILMLYFFLVFSISALLRPMYDAHESAEC